MIYNWNYRAASIPWSGDIGDRQQMLYNLMTKGVPEITTRSFANCFGEDHFCIIFLLLAPLALVFHTPLPQIAASVLATSVMGYALVKLAVQHLGARIAPYAFAVFLLHPATINMYLRFGGREAVFAAMFFALSINFYLDKKFFPWVLSLVFASICVEYTSAIVVGYVLPGLLSRRSRRWVLFPLLFGCAYFVLINKVVMPWLRGSDGFSGLNIYNYAYLGSDPLTIVRNIFLNADTIFFAPRKIFLFLALLGPFLFLPLAGIEFLLIPTSQFLLMILPKSYNYFDIRWWYHVPAFPFIFAAAVIGLNRFPGILDRKSFRFLCALVGILLAINFCFWSWTYTRNVGDPSPLSDYRIDEAFSVAVQDPFHAHFALRPKLFTFPDIRDADFIVLGFERSPWVLTKEEYKERVRQLLVSGDYGVVVLHDNGDAVLRKNWSQEKNAAALERLMRADPGGAPSEPVFKPLTDLLGEGRP